MYLTDQECYTDALKRNTDDNKESALSKMVSVSTFIFQILISIFQCLMLIAFVYFIKKHKRGRKDHIAMQSLKSQQFIKSTTPSRENSQNNTTPTNSSSRENSCKSNSSLLSNHI